MTERETMENGNIVKRKLFEEGYRFNFFKAVHLLERFNGGDGTGKGLSPEKDPVRFGVKPGFSFPASDIQKISVNGNGGGSTPQVPQIPLMNVNFMGLIGPKGVLPDWYNSHALSCDLKKDHVFTDFLDLFHHRLISLFYRAWKKYRLVENYNGEGGDDISNILECLAGAGDSEKAAAPGFFDHARKRLIFFCGLVARTVPTVAAIETVIGHAVGGPVRVEQFVERTIPVHRHDRTRLGRRNSTLKGDALCGANIRDVSSFFRVNIGPLPWKQYMAFSPGSRNLEMVRELVAHLAGIEYEFGLHLLIRGKEIPALGLGSRGKGPKLGRTATLRRPHRPHPRDINLTATRRAAARKAA